MKNKSNHITDFKKFYGLLQVLEARLKKVLSEDYGEGLPEYNEDWDYWCAYLHGLEDAWKIISAKEQEDNRSEVK